MKPKTVGRVGNRRCPTGDGALEGVRFTGLVSGARILTLKGERPVDGLRAGERVLTREGAVPVTRVEVVSMVVPTVYIIAGSLGHCRLERDALLTAQQTVHLRDWRAPAFCGTRNAFVEAAQLVDGEFVRSLGQQVVTLHRVFCATPQVLYADGLELGTADTAGVARVTRAS
ncbi:Hint domain-containing protein [Roseobacter sp.]|uniref:Hint domain-containing protein n=1 Tax=Roseobacter sp. TaxID=1907202 RepID=UPI002966DF80|nr:Hint domain-containing protein [Roseobacter sp.]MDW3182127.1 Hint domain-containing protein [Roseobacter sp.]